MKKLMKLTPVNGHLLIEPVSHETFMASSQETYQEVGVVVEIDPSFVSALGKYDYFPKIGDKVFFDSWMAAKYPGSTPDSFVWLVNWENVRAVQHAESSLPE